MEKQIPTTQPATAEPKKASSGLHNHRWLSAMVASSTLVGMVAAFALSGTPPEDNVAQREVLEQLRTNSIALSGSDKHGFLREETILRSDTIASLAGRLGIKEARAIDFLRQDTSAQTISRQLRPGKTISATTGRNGELLSLFFPLNGADAALTIERTSDGFVAQEEWLRLEKQTVVKSGEIQSSLFGATDDADIPDAIATQLAEIFSSDIDFHRGLRIGDRFSVVYELLMYRGQPVRTGRILSAEFTNNQRALNAYWFENGQVKGGYYAADGKSLRKTFLRSPLAFSRITSRFSGARLHPVLKTWRAHKGIDYGAPTGTRVRSVADGTISHIGKSSGYGNLIVIKHQGGYSTAYGHLNGFAKGLRQGAHVTQEETIGFVGQTGLATGPHLHYEFRINDRQTDPLTLALPGTPPLSPAQLRRFQAAAAPLRQQLELASQIRLASHE